MLKWTFILLAIGTLGLILLTRPDTLFSAIVMGASLGLAGITGVIVFDTVNNLIYLPVVNLIKGANRYDS